MAARRSSRSSWFRNTFSIFILAGAVGTLYLSWSPVPVKTGLSEASLVPVDLTEFTMPASFEDDDSIDESAATPESHRTILQSQKVMLERAITLLNDQGRYTATFTKQERIGKEMSDPQVMQIKVRQQPFSLYLKWVVGGEKGREILYVDGENDGNMIVNPGGWKSRVVPALKLDPEGSLAMAESRHPVTNLGLVKLCEKLLDSRNKDLKTDELVRCRLIEGQNFAGRPTLAFLVNYPSKSYSDVYRKSLVMMDKETGLPVCIRNYDWPGNGQEALVGKELDKATLLECFSYTDIDFERDITAAAFSRDNPEYSFRR